MSDAPHVEWSKGGTASFLAAADDRVTLRSSIPSPPGSTLEATFIGDPSAPKVKVKVHGSKREPDGSYTVKGRLLEATRALRERLAALVV